MPTLIFTSPFHNLIILPVLSIPLHHLIAMLLWETSCSNLPCPNAFSQCWMQPQEDTRGQQRLHTKRFICWGLYILTFPGFCLLKMKRLLKKLVPVTHPSAKWWQSSGTPSSRGWTYPQLQWREEFGNRYYCSKSVQKFVTNTCLNTTFSSPPAAELQRWGSACLSEHHLAKSSTSTYSSTSVPVLP